MEGKIFNLSLMDSIRKQSDTSAHFVRPSFEPARLGLPHGHGGIIYNSFFRFRQIKKENEWICETQSVVNKRLKSDTKGGEY